MDDSNCAPGILTKIMPRVGVSCHQLADGDDPAGVEGEAMLDGAGKELPYAARGRRHRRVECHLRGTEDERAVVVDLVGGPKIRAEPERIRIVVLTFERPDREIEPLYDGLDAFHHIRLDFRDRVVGRYAVVHPELHVLRHRVDLYPTQEVVYRLRCLYAVLGWAVGDRQLFGQGLQVALVD